MRWMAFALVLLAACDPGFDVHGSLVDSDGKPVAGAEVYVQCSSGGSPIAESTTDATGKFQGGQIGVYRDSCWIETKLTPDALPIQLSTIKRYCTQSGGGCNSNCQVVEANLRLPAH